jgi:hypothetical protein
MIDKKVQDGRRPTRFGGRSSPTRPSRPRQACGAGLENQADLHKNRGAPRRHPRQALLPICCQVSKPVPAVLSLNKPRERPCQRGRSGPGWSRGHEMARKDGWPRAGRTPAQTPAGRCPVPRRHLKKLGAAGALRSGPDEGKSGARRPRHCSNAGISNGSRPWCRHFGNPRVLFRRYRGGRQGHFGEDFT